MQKDVHFRYIGDSFLQEFVPFAQIRRDTAYKLVYLRIIVIWNRQARVGHVRIEPPLRVRGGGVLSPRLSFLAILLGGKLFNAYEANPNCTEGTKPVLRRL